MWGETVFRLLSCCWMPDSVTYWDSSWHCIRSPDSNMYAHIMCLYLMFCLSPQLAPEDYRENAYTFMPEEVDTDVSWVLDTCVTWCSVQSWIIVHISFSFSLQTKLSRLCEQDKVVRTQEDKLQQLYREKVTKHCKSFKMIFLYKMGKHSVWVMKLARVMFICTKL